MLHPQLFWQNYQINTTVRAQKFWEEDLELILAKTEIIGLSKEIAIKAGETKMLMRINHPNFGLADAIIYEIAKSKNAPVLTGDEHFKGEENVIYIKG